MHAFDIVKLNAFPPASSGRLAPEEEKLLRHANGVAICCAAAATTFAANICPKSCQRYGAYDSFVWFRCTMAPGVCMIETTACKASAKLPWYYFSPDGITHPAVSISIRCCSVVPGSSLLRRPEKMPFCFSKALPAARLTSIISCCSMSFFGGMA